MDFRKTAKIMATMVLFLTAIGIVSAQAEPGGANISDLRTLGQAAEAAASSTPVEAGNVSGADLNANMSTYRWAGMTGNVTGTIRLADAGGNVAYNWTASGLNVYASTGSSITWSSLTNAAISDVTTAFDWLAGVNYADNYTNTFASNGAFTSGLFTGITADYAPMLSSNGAFATFALYDTTEIVFAGNVSEDTTNYRGEPADFEMLLPENGTLGDTNTQAYFFWVELQ